MHTRPGLLLLVLIILTSVCASCWLLFFGGIKISVDYFWAASDWIRTNKSFALLVFFFISLLSQMIVMPSGSLMLLLAGFVLGAVPAAAVFAVAQILTAWPVYFVFKRAGADFDQAFLPGTSGRRISKLRDRLASLRGNELLATVLLRMTPIIPSAGACLLAAFVGISLKPFLIGSLLTCWVRPLFFATSGEAVSAVLLRTDAGSALSGISVWPLLLLFLVALLLFVINWWLNYRTS